jgi:4-hydroxy-3-polyprenylbenzoate decarboxylase
MKQLCEAIAAAGPLPSCPLIIVCDDSEFMSATLSNFLWAAFTRSNPSHDIYGVNSSYASKHWSCDNMVLDARLKPHQAPPLIPDPAVQARIGRLFAAGGSLEALEASISASKS